MIKKNKDKLIVSICLVLFGLFFYILNSSSEALNSIQKVNRLFGLTSFLSISIAYLISNLHRFRFLGLNKIVALKKYFGIFGFLLASVHILISTLNIATDNYYYLNENETLTAQAQLTVLFGVSAFTMFLFPAITSIPGVARAMKPKKWLKLQRRGYWGVLIIIAHIITVNLANNQAGLLSNGNKIAILIVLIISSMALILKMISILYKK